MTRLGRWLAAFAALAAGGSGKAPTECPLPVVKEMPYVQLGRSGLLVSRLSYGAWVTFGHQVDEDAAFELLRLAFVNGINLFDNAEAYANGVAEEIMGRALKRLEAELNVTRSEYVVTTKIFFGSARPRWYANSVGLSRKHIIEGLRASLQRLNLDYVDVVFAHRFDEHTPMEEIVRAFNRVIDDNLAFYWCTSEWPASMIREAHHVAARLGMVGPICEQPQYNIVHRQRFEAEYARLYEEFGMGTTTWSALASGVLTGKYTHADVLPEGSRLSLDAADYILREFRDGTRHGMTFESLLEMVLELQGVAERAGCSMPQLAVAWCLKNKDVSTVILGASKPAQLIDTLGALDCAERLSPEIMQEIDDLFGNRPQGRRDWNPTTTRQF